MHFPKQEDFAILLMSELTKHRGGQAVPLSSVARNHGVSPLFLKKIARMLRQAGLIKSREGVTGGYMLAKASSSITVWDVIRAVDRHYQVPPQIKNREKCPLNSTCLPQTINQSLITALERSFRTITLSDLVVA